MSRELGSVFCVVVAESRGEVVELADDAVVSHASQTELRFESHHGITDEHDVRVRLEHRRGPLREAPTEPDIDRALDVPGREVGGLTGIEEDHAGNLQRHDVVDREQRRRFGVEQRAEPAVQLSVELEVVRTRRLRFGDERDEPILVHRPERVVQAPLLSDGRARLAREVPTARRACAVCWVHPCRVGKLGKQCVVQRVVQLAREHVGGELGIGRGKQVGPTDIADEERVAGEHRVRRRVVGVLVDQDADRLGSVTRRRDDLEGDASEREPLPVVESVDRKPDLGCIAVADDGTSASGKLEMATQEVGVDVRLDDSLDGESSSSACAR